MGHHLLRAGHRSLLPKATGSANGADTSGLSGDSGLTQHIDTFDGPLSAQPYDTTGKTITKVECYGAGGDGDAAMGGGGGAYSQAAASLPGPQPATLYLTIAGGGTEEGSYVEATLGGGSFVSVAAGLNGGDSGAGGLAADSAGDLLHSGGNGSALGDHEGGNGGGAGGPDGDGQDGTAGGSNTGGLSGIGDGTTDGRGGMTSFTPPGTAGAAPGGGGACDNPGAPGRIVITYLS